MPTQEIHRCQCPVCQQEADHPDKAEHRRINLLLSRLDEQQRRWFAAHESKRLGYGGDRLPRQITWLGEETISKRRQEIAKDLKKRPSGRGRPPGAGGHARGKKNPAFSPPPTTS